MHRIDTPNARPDTNGTGKAGYHLNNDLVGVDPTNLDPAALNAIQEEICKVIEQTGTALAKGNNSQLWTAINWAITQQIALGTASIAINAIYPVGITVEFAQNVDPNSLWAGTTWARFAEGRTTIGYKSGDADFGTVGATGGAKTLGVSLTVGLTAGTSLYVPDDEVTTPSINTFSDYINSGDAASSNDIGLRFKLNTSNNANLPPYVVTSKWVRTA